MDAYLAVIFLLFFIMSFFVSKGIFGSAFSPFLLLVGNFFFAYFMLYSVDFIYNDLSSESTLIIAISLISFTLGCILVPLLLYRRKSQSEVDVGDLKQSIGFERSDKKILYLLFFLSSLGFLSQLITLQQQYGIIEVLKNPNMLNIAYSTGEIQYNSLFSYLKKLTLVNSVLIHMYIRKFKYRGLDLWIMFILSFAFNISVKRSVLIYMIVINIILFMYYRTIENSEKRIGKVKKSKKGYLALMSVILLAGYYFAHMQSVLNKQNTIEGSFWGIELPQSLMTIITYYATNLTSFSIYLTDIPDVPFLSSTLRLFEKAICNLLSIPFDDSHLALDFVSTPEPFNTTVMQYYTYIEGGILWVILIYFFLGLFATRQYFIYKTRKTDISLLYLSLVSFVLVMSIREYVLIQVDFWISLFVIVLIGIYFKKRKKGSKQ